ncbi:hypothetical protein C8R45DRAFT_983533 [Mycena sanguinolenta]|nr:hypothetical protein C8R45DRAFT_983533 [Mycena sanguinolenta]
MSSAPQAPPSLLAVRALTVVRHQRRVELEGVDDEIRTLQSSHDSLIRSLQQEHDHQLQALQRRRLQALEAMRVLRIMDHLPAEVLVTIFLYVLGPRSPASWTISEIRTLNTLISVCTRWATIARENESFWRCLRVFVADVGSSGSPAWTRNSAFKAHQMLYHRLRLSGFGTVEVEIGALSAVHRDYGVVPVLATHAWRLERLTIAVRASALWHLGAHLPRLQLLRIAVLDASLTCQPEWEPFHARRLHHFEIENVRAIESFLQSIPWTNLLSLQLLGGLTELSPPALLYILAQAPWLVVCHAVLRQSIDDNGSGDNLGVLTRSYPEEPIAMLHLCELILELVPLDREAWTRAEEPFLEALTLPVIRLIAMPELWFAEDARAALNRLKDRSHQLPQEIWMTAVPPGQWEDTYQEYSAEFPGVMFGGSFSVLANQELRTKWERCLERYRRRLYYEESDYDPDGDNYSAYDADSWSDQGNYMT